MRKYKAIIGFILILSIITGFIQAKSYDLTDTRVFLLRNVYEIANNGKNTVYNVSIKVLLGANSDSAYQNCLDYSVNLTPRSVDTDSYGNNYARIDIMALKPGEKINIAVDRTLENSSISFDKNLYKLDLNYDGFFKSPSHYKYILPGEKVESDDLRIKKKAEDIAGKGTPMKKARSIYDFVNLHIDYNEDSKHANKGALSGLINKEGVCGDYASLFTAICRAAGIPSRVVSGYWHEGRFREEQWVDVSNMKHSWSEFYLPSIGWIPVEPTFLYYYNGKRVPSEKHFARIEKDSRHFINNYVANKIENDIDVQYSFYESSGTSLKLSLKEEKIKLIKKNSQDLVKNSLSDIENNWAKEYIEELFRKGIVFPREKMLYKPNSHITRAEFAAYIVNVMGIEQIKSKEKYKDLPSNHPLARHVAVATEVKFIEGYNGYYYPDQSITREDIAVIMGRALDYLKVDRDKSLELYFNDKNLISSYALPSVKAMDALGIMKGKPGNIFAPKDFATRAEAAKVIFEFKEMLKDSI